MRNHIISWIFLLTLAGCTKSPFLEKPKPELIIRGDDPRLQSATIHFFKDTVYVLAVNLQRDAGQSLVIDAGTLIKVNNNLSITINPGAVIEAGGTADEPIVFTSSAFKGGAGIGTGTISSERFWHGIRVYGNYSTSPGTGSGILRYVRIEFAGSSDFQEAALLLQDVTKETTLENIQVSYAHITPSFRFSGGDCNAKNLVSYAANLHDFYIYNGHHGKLQNLLALRHPYFPTQRRGNSLSGLFIEGADSYPYISNLTVIGPDLQKGTSFVYSDVPPLKVSGVVTTGGARFRIRNSAFIGFPVGAYYLDERVTALALRNGESELTYSLLHATDTSKIFYLSPSAYPPFTTADLSQFLMSPQFGNTVLASSAEFMLEDPFNYDVNPNPMPVTGSPLLSGADFSGDFDDPFFEKVLYRGFAGTENWMQGWTNFIPLQTNYN